MLQWCREDSKRRSISQGQPRQENTYQQGFLSQSFKFPGAKITRQRRQYQQTKGSYDLQHNQRWYLQSTQGSCCNKSKKYSRKVGLDLGRHGEQDGASYQPPAIRPVFGRYLPPGRPLSKAFSDNAQSAKQDNYGGNAGGANHQKSRERT